MIEIEKGKDVFRQIYDKSRDDEFSMIWEYVMDTGFQLQKKVDASFQELSTFLEALSLFFEEIFATQLFYEYHKALADGCHGEDEHEEAIGSTLHEWHRDTIQYLPIIVHYISNREIRKVVKPSCYGKPALYNTKPECKVCSLHKRCKVRGKRVFFYFSNRKKGKEDD